MNKEENNYEVIHLDWDTEEFKAKSCKVILKKNITKKELEAIQQYIDQNNYKFITIENNSNNEINNYLLGSIPNIVLVDVNIKFLKNVQEVNVELSKVEIQNNMKFNQRILEISEKAFVFSRFYTDTRLPENRYKIYLNWTRNSFEKDNKYFATYLEQDIIQGFILFSINKEANIVIELIAVDKKGQNKGIGSFLMRSVEQFAFKRDIKKIKVGTQINNINAQNFYIKYGFKHIDITSIYHWWNEGVIR